MKNLNLIDRLKQAKDLKVIMPLIETKEVQFLTDSVRIDKIHMSYENFTSNITLIDVGKGDEITIYLFVEPDIK